MRYVTEVAEDAAVLGQRFAAIIADALQDEIDGGVDTSTAERVGAATAQFVTAVRETKHPFSTTAFFMSAFVLVAARAQAAEVIRRLLGEPRAPAIGLVARGMKAIAERDADVTYDARGSRWQVVLHGDTPVIVHAKTVSQAAAEVAVALARDGSEEAASSD